MTANKAQYLLSIADIDSRFFEVTRFSGEDAISSLYWFDIEFRMSAVVGATGDNLPTLNEYGDYNVNLPFVLEDSKIMKVGDYGGSKDIRLAEMVLAYVDGNPDRPIGLGFVPNIASPSVINDRNLSENIMRTWGGNE